jgi:tetratricopeptide (TPR) repeat protein
VIDRQEFERRFFEIEARLKTLTDREPALAIREARSLVPDGVLDQDSIESLAAATLIAAGVAAHDPAAVDEAVQILERLLAAMPGRGDIEYCLANGLSAQADLSTETRPQWYLETRETRRRARFHYQTAGSNESTPTNIAAQAFTNLGNSLLTTHRLVEAYDSYLKALKFDSTNGVALTGAARALLYMVKYGLGDPQVLPTVAAKYLGMAREDPARIRELAGEQGYQEILPLLELDVPAGELPDLSNATDYQQFVAEHRLSLAPTIEGLDLTMLRWDSLAIGRVIEPISAGAGAPPLFAMFNVLKSEFLAARHLAFAALEDNIPESGKYADTLDYAVYGVQPASLTLAQRACVDLLDKIAVATSEYLHLPGDPGRISFMNRWFDRQRGDEVVRLQEAIQAEVAAGNWALTAITEVAVDVEMGGFLQDKRGLRHSSTHRFTVLHDIGCTPSRESPYVDHFEFEGFREQLLETLRLTRAVLLYFAQMVMIREYRHHDGTTILPSIRLPDHDWVRGRDS